MINSLAKLSLLAGVPAAALAAYGILSYYQNLGACVEATGAAQDACLLDLAATMPEPSLEMIMSTCRKADLFLSLYKADIRTRERYSKDEVMAQHAKACKA